MRIVITSRDYRPSEGGIATYLLNLALGMTSAGHDVLVVAPRQPGDREFDRAQPFTTRRIPGAFFRTPLWTLCLLWHILRFRGRVVVNGEWLSGFHVWLLRPIAGLRYFVIAHGLELPEVEYSFKKRIRKRLSFIKKSILRSATLVFPNSENTASLVKDCGVPDERIRVVHPAVDPSEFVPRDKPADLVEKYGLGSCPVILSISRLSVMKGQDVVIKALALLRAEGREARYVIVGRGPDKAYFEELARDEGVDDRVIFADYVAACRLIDFYNLCDIFVMLSRQMDNPLHLEGFGIVFLEAGACAKPVIGGNSGGIPDAVLDGQTGLLADPNSPEDCARALRKLLDDPAWAAELGRNGRRRIEKELNWPASVERMLTLMTKALGDSP